MCNYIFKEFQDDMTHQKIMFYKKKINRTVILRSKNS